MSHKFLTDIYSVWAAGAMEPVHILSSLPVPLALAWITLIGGGDKLGKSAMAGQVLFDAARHDANLTVLIACPEMPAARILDRQVSRLAGIPALDIEKHLTTLDDVPRLLAAREEIRKLGPQIAFLDPPFTVEHITAEARLIGARLVLVD